MNFTPVIRTSHSIPHSLLEFAKERKLATKSIDFELLSFSTLLQREGEKSYELISDPSVITLEELHNPLTSIKQEYSIKIKPKSTKTSISLVLNVNKLKTKASIKILKTSLFKKSNSLLKDLRDMIYREKLRHGLYIGLFEPNLDKQLTKLLQIVPYDKALPKDVSFGVALGILPQMPRDAQLEKLFEKREESSKNILDGIKKGELVARFIKAKNGVNGRACTGKYLKVREANSTLLKPTIDHTLYEKESNDAIEYFAKESGHVLFANNLLSISQSLSLDGANFKESAVIDAGELNKDISVNITHKKSHNEDAIGRGVTIDVKELNVEGSIAANVNIATKELKVDAQTHKNSTMEVENSASIKLHRGDLIANDAEVDMLESGKITAHESIYIKKMLGGEAIAPVVKVDELLSNATITASKRIEIKSLHGEHNQLIIDPKAIESYHIKLDKLKVKIKKHKEKVATLEQDFEKRYSEHVTQLDRVKTFQQRVMSAQKSGKKAMKQDILRVKLYKQNSVKLSEEKVLIEKEKTKLASLVQEEEKLENKDLHAQIVVHSSYDGHSKVTFVSVKTGEKIEYFPEGEIETISLTLNDKNERVIKLD